MEVVACSLSESIKSTEHGVVVEAGMSCTGGGVGEPETLRVGPHLSGEADIGPAIPGNSRAAPMRRFAAERGATKRPAGGLGRDDCNHRRGRPRPIGGGYDFKLAFAAA
jgi:hypothetical protein